MDFSHNVDGPVRSVTVKEAKSPYSTTSCSRAAASAVNLHAASDRSEPLPTAYVNNTLVDNGYDPGIEA
jgi:hypothetical protein